MWTPRPVQQRVAEHFVELMERALDAGAGGGAAETQAHLLLKLSSQLLMRVDSSSEDTTVTGEKSLTLTSRVRERFDKADSGSWRSLLNDLLAEVQAGTHAPAAAQPGGSARAASGLQQAADSEWSRVFDSCCLP